MTRKFYSVLFAACTVATIGATACSSGSEPGADGEVGSTTSAVIIPKCDAYEEVSCTDEGPKGQILCTCTLKPAYACDPAQSGLTCSGAQPEKCVGGHWQADGAACENATACRGGTCCVPSTAACESQYDCGTAPDGCGGTISCGWGTCADFPGPQHYCYVASGQTQGVCICFEGKCY